MGSGKIIPLAYLGYPLFVYLHFGVLGASRKERSGELLRLKQRNYLEREKRGLKKQSGPADGATKGSEEFPLLAD